MYMVGGNTLGDRVYRYDPDADTWQIVLTLPEKLLAPMSRVVDGWLLVVSSGGGNEPVPITRLYGLEFPAKAIDPVIQTLPEQLAPSDRVILAGEVEHYDEATEDNSLYDWQLQPLSGASNGDALIGLETNHTVQEGTEGGAQFGYLISFTRFSYTQSLAP